MKNKSWWFFSTLVSVVAIGLLLGLWWHMNHYVPKHPQLTSRAAVDHFLSQHWESHLNAQQRDEPITKIETGIFIQSLKFFDSSEVNLSGYIWQRYRDGINDFLTPAPGEVGFILPERVNSGSDAIREAYRHRNNDSEVIGWYFDTTLRQPFEYSTYPFDHKTVWVRLWPRQFSANIVLVPDFDAYDTTGEHDIFGIEQDIVLGAWERENTFFDYKLTSYDTNFGIEHYIGQQHFPELHYNFVIKRNFGNAFIVHLLPLFLVAALLYGTLLTISDNEELAIRHDFSTTGVIGTCSALFFVVLLAHIQLREQFAGSKIVYMEYFYFLMYGLLVAASAYTFMFNVRSGGNWMRFVHYRDNLVLKTGFWPFVFISMAVITAVVVFS